jgi:hypothetical protein
MIDDDDDDECGALGGMKLAGAEEICPSVTFSTTNPI